jgi:hypothetical protein
MRYRLTPTSQQKLAQIMTPPHLAARLMECLTGSADDWLELGSGRGAIANACLDIRNPNQYFGLEVDAELMQQSPQKIRTNFMHCDVLIPGNVTASLGNRLFSRVAGNPPYGMQAVGAECLRRIAELCPGIPQINDWIQLDLYFVLESLARLSRPGEAAFIVGASLAEDSTLLAFRRALIASASEVECFELPSKIFDGDVEVQSYLLIARFGSTRLKHVRLGRMVGEELKVEAERWVSPIDAIERLDLSFHEFSAMNNALITGHDCRKLGEYGVTVVRGSRTRTQFDDLGIEFFHTSDFPQNKTEVRFSKDYDYGFQVATAGDILLPRVGTRCLDRQALVTKGRRHYTEAVFRLRVPKDAHAKVVNWILSEKGSEWRQAAAKGACAKHLTVPTLLNMPIPSSYS